MTLVIRLSVAGLVVVPAGTLRENPAEKVVTDFTEPRVASQVFDIVSRQKVVSP